MLLPALYHWSPSSRRDEIRAHGLQPFSAPTVCSDPDTAMPYICLSPSPSSAWSLSGDMDWVSNVESWDLWQVRLGDHDEVRFRATFGNVLEEIKVYTAIPAERAWFVGTREAPAARSVAT